MSELIKIDNEDGSSVAYTSTTDNTMKFKIYNAPQVIFIEDEGNKVPLLWEELFQLADIIKEIKNGH